MIRTVVNQLYSSINKLVIKTESMTLDDCLKIVQILFYVSAGTIAVLTFLSAKKGLLNPINTEYHKRAFEKIEHLSDDLLSEFDPTSDNYWAKEDPLKEFLEEIHDVFNKNKVQILKDKKFVYGQPIPKSL